MAENFHKHISKALHSKNKRKEQGDKSPSEEIHSDELETRLDKIIASSKTTKIEKSEHENTIPSEMISLFHSTEKLNQAIAHFFDNLKQDAIPDEIRLFKNSHEQKMHSSDYLALKQEITNLISKGTYGENEKLISNLLNYVKTSIVIPPHENEIIVKCLFEDNSLQKPYTFFDLSEICLLLKSKALTSVSQETEKTRKFITYILMMNAKCIQQEEECKKLNTINMTELKTKSFQLLESSQLNTFAEELEKEKDKENIQLSQNMIQELSQNLDDYQNLLHDYAKERIKFVITNDPAQIKPLQSIHLKLTHCSTLINPIFKLAALFQSSLHDLPETKQTLANNIQTNLASLTNMLQEAQLALNTLGHEKLDEKYILLMRIINGNFFNAQEHNNLCTATYALHGIINPFDLLNGIIKHFPQYTTEQREECLFFLKNYLLLDTNNSLIPGQDDRSEITDKIEMICDLALTFAADNQLTNELVEEITNILAKKSIEKAKSFSSYIEKITQGKISGKMLIRTLNTINHDFRKKHDSAVVNEYCAIVNAILDSPHTSSDIESNINLEEAIEGFCSKLETFSEYQEQVNSIRNKLKLREHNPTSSITSDTDTPVESRPHYELVKLFDDIAHNQMSVMEYEKSLENFVDKLRLDFTGLFAQIDLSELRDLAWKKDKVAIDNGFLPHAPSVRTFSQYHSLLVRFFGLAILNDFANTTLTPRESITEIKRIHEFIERAVLIAIDKGAISTMITLELALRHPAVARLKLSKSERVELRSKYFDDIKNKQDILGKLIQEKDSVPFLILTLIDMATEYKKKYANEFEKRIAIGKKISVMHEKIQIAKSRNTVLSDIASQTAYIMQSNQLCLTPILADDILLDEDRIIELLSEASEYIKPKEFKTYKTNEFTSLADLKKHLAYCQKRMEDFHLSEKNPEKSIIEYLMQVIKNDSNMMFFQDSLQILDLIGLIHLSMGREYKNYDSYLDQVLSAYQDKASALLKDKQQQRSSVLGHFFSVYSKYHKIKTFRESQISSLNPFSARRHLKETIAALDKYLRYYKKLLAMSKEREVQKTYSDLLTKVLTGDKQDPVIHFGPSQQTETQESASLLPDTEFPVPQAEPEHPDYIGINRTMNFNPDAQQRSIFELFDTIELKSDFRSAFPWSADIDSLFKLENSIADPSLNLLVTDQLVAPDLQIAVIDFVLLSLDILGKIAGFNGDLAIRNFTTIKNVTDGLQEITESLSIPIFDEAKFRAHLNEMTLSLSDLNQDLIEMIQSQDPLCPAQQNPAMNDFCHINEHLTHQLMGIPYQKSVLSPLTPDSQILNKMSESLKRELLKKGTSTEVDVSRGE